MTDQIAIEVVGTEVVQTQMPDVAHLMELALGQGTEGAEALATLVGLQEHMMRIQAGNNLAAALEDFQNACPQIRQQKTAKIATRGGGSYSFTYAPLDEIDRTIRPHLRAHGLSYAFDSTVEGDQMTVTCTVTHRDGASKSGSFTCPTESASGASAAQKYGMAHTYSKRQALGNALGLITTSADVDDVGYEDPSPINEQQLAEIRTLIEAKRANIDKFLAFAGVSSLADIPQSSYGRLTDMLKSKRDAT